MKAKEYKKIVFWEDGYYVGMCPDLFFGGVHGKNEQRVYRELCKVVAEVSRLSKKKSRTRRRA